MRQSFRRLITDRIRHPQKKKGGRPAGSRSRPMRCQSLEKREMLAADINESGIGQLYYVDVNGNDNAAGTFAAPFATLDKAVDTAIAGSLAQGTKTKIIVNDGLYVNQPNAGLWTDTNDFPVWPGQAADTVLVIEGQSPEGVEFRGVNADYRQLTFEGKSNLVIRDMAFSNLVSAFDFVGIDNFGALELVANPDQTSDGQFGPGRSHDLLLDNVEVSGSDRRGAVVGLYEDVTIIDSDFSDNIHEVGLQFRDVDDALVERTEISRNGDAATTSASNFGNSGFQFSAANTILRNVTASGNREGSGIRMDFLAENVTIVDSTFNDNAEDGVFFETAFGPVTLDNVTANNNGRAGVHIATTNNFTIENSELVGNDRAGVMVTEQRRDESNFAPPEFLWAQDPAYSRQNYQDANGTVIGGRPMNWNQNTIVRDTTITAVGPDAVIYSSGYDQSGVWEDHYDDWIATQITAENNTYAADRDDAFNDSTRTGQRTFVDFETWRSLSGADLTSSFNGDSGGVETLVGRGDFDDNTSQGWRSFGFGGASSSVSYANGRADVNITQANGQRYRVQLLKDGIPVESYKTYKLTFDVSATNSPNISVVLRNDVSGGTSNPNRLRTYGLYGINNIPSTTTTYTRYFNVGNRADATARLSFFLGQKTGTISVDNIRLEEVPSDTSGGTLVGPGDFADQTDSGFQLIRNYGLGTDAYLLPQAENAQVVISNGGSQRYQLRLRKQFAIEANTDYVLTFDAWAPQGNRNFIVDLRDDDGAQQFYGNKFFAVTTTPTQYSHTFSVGQVDDPTAQLRFLLGRSNRNVTFDNISLLKAGTTGVPDPTIDNASFENGLADWVSSGTVTTGNFGGTSDGNLAAVFNIGNDVTADGVISQAVETINGQRYRVTFDFKAGGNASRQSRINARALNSSGVTRGETTQTLNGVSASAPYSTFSFEFVANSTSTTLEFRDQSTDVNGIDAWIDNVRMVRV